MTEYVKKIYCHQLNKIKKYETRIFAFIWNTQKSNVACLKKSLEEDACCDETVS